MARADPKPNTDWLVVAETSRTTASANSSLTARQPSTNNDDSPNKRFSYDKLRHGLILNENREFSYQPSSSQFHDAFLSVKTRAPPRFYQSPRFINTYPIVLFQQLQMQKFTGNIERFPIFAQEFKEFVEFQCFDDYRRLLYLQMHFVGELAN